MMEPTRRTAVVAGLLFIIATATTLASTVLLTPTTSSDYLTGVAAHANQVRAGVLLELSGGLAVVLIAAVLFPVLRGFDEGFAASYLGLRIVEGVVVVIGALGALLILSLSQDYVGSASPDTAAYQAAGALPQAIGTWTFALDPLVFGAGAILFYYLLIRTWLVPRWLSTWGLAGAVLVIGVGLSALWGSIPYILAVPIAIQEMVLAVWLVVVGFNSVPPGGPVPQASSLRQWLVGRPGAS